MRKEVCEKVVETIGEMGEKGKKIKLNQQSVEKGNTKMESYYPLINRPG